MKTYFEKKTILITGAASGLGRILAKKLSSQHAELLLVDINLENLAQLKEEIRSDESKVRIYGADIAKKENIDNLFKQISADQLLESIDLVINNAGIVMGKKFDNLSIELIQKTFAVNTFAPISIIKHILPVMKKRGRGHIVNICSASALTGVPRLSDYGASKAALYNFGEALSQELIKEKSPVLVTNIAPFYIDTGMFSGVQTRFPWLLPIQKQEVVASKIIDTIERKHPRLITPWFIYSIFLVQLLPKSIGDKILNFFGVNSSMDDFQGRR